MTNETGSLYGSCLCGDVTYKSSQEHSEMWNCHCYSCRKASSVAYATWIKTQVSSFSWLIAKSLISRHYSSKTMLRSFCSRCGSVLPAYSEKENYIFLPASGITTEHNLVPSTDLFTLEMPTWYDMNGHLPCHTIKTGREHVREQYADQHTECLNSENEGGCLCGSIRYRITGVVDAIRACHCSRCRRRSGSAYFSAMPVLFSEFHLDGDEKNIASFFLPGSQYYGYNFCRTCGTLIPTVFPDGKRTVIAAGSLDTTPPIRLKYHIFYGSKARWLNLNETEKCFNERPPGDFDWRNNSNVFEEAK